MRPYRLNNFHSGSASSDWRARYVPSTSINSSNPFKKQEPSPWALLQDLGDIVKTIPAPSSTADDESSKSASLLQDFETVASYSWKNSKSPTIIVPGSPPVWQDRPMPYRVPRDSGTTVFVDQNAGRLSSSPLLPLIAAVSHEAPGFSLGSVDFITDRNGLRKLLRWSIGQTQPSFRVDMERAGQKTILMERWEPQNKQDGGPGFEQGFKKASTKPAVGCEGADGNHRIITYKFAGFKMLVRYTADACLPDSYSCPEPTSSILENKDPVAEITERLEKKLSINSSTPSSPEKPIIIPTINGKSLTILPRGTLIPQSRMLELKTTGHRNLPNFNWPDTYVQLFLSQTPHLYVCLHVSGNFDEINKKSLAVLETQEMATKAQDGLRRLEELLGAIRTAVMEVDETVKLSLVCDLGGSKMTLYKRNSKSWLPEEFYTKFNVE